MAFFALIPAAGTGTRIGTEAGALPKQYRRIAGKAMIEYSLDAFAACPSIDACYVVIAPDDRYFEKLGLSAERATPLRVGGATRHLSVANGLAAIEADDSDWILVHDAARPGVTTQMIERLIESACNDPVGGILATPVVDTLKEELPRVGSDASLPRIARTVPRTGLWQAQTPQMFRYGLLKHALGIDQGFPQGTSLSDEASAVETLGLQPMLVAGSATNFKVTHAEELHLAELLLKEDR